MAAATKKSTVEITKETAIGLLNSLQIKGADAWDEATLQKKINSFGKLPVEKIKGAAAKVKDKAFSKLFLELHADLLKGRTVTVLPPPVAEEETFDLNEEEGTEEATEEEQLAAEDEVVEEVTEEAGEELGEEPEAAPTTGGNKAATAKAAPGKKASTNNKAEKPAKPAKEPVEKDRFGMRLGSRAARLNEAINGTPKTIKQIQEDANYDKSINNHMKKLLDQGHVLRHEESGTWYDPKMVKGKLVFPVKAPKAAPAPAAAPAAKPAAAKATAPVAAKPAAKAAAPVAAAKAATKPVVAKK